MEWRENKVIRKCCLLAVSFFLLGVFTVNIIGKNNLANYGALTVWEYAPFAVSGNIDVDLFWKIGLFRTKNLIVLLLAGKAFSKKLVSEACQVIIWFLMGSFFTMAVMERGIYGVVLFAAAVVPQWSAYLTAIMLYGKRRKGKWILPEMILFLAGFLIEWIISPKILKIFF